MKRWDGPFLDGVVWHDEEGVFKEGEMRLRLRLSEI
jgi:hypothetical protein